MNKQIKILHLIPRLSYSGGVENYVKNLCIGNRSSEIKHEICTFYKGNNTQILQNLNDKGIKVYSLDETLFESISNRYLRFLIKNIGTGYLSKYLDLKKLIKTDPPDVLVCHGEDAELIGGFIEDIIKINVLHGDSYFPKNIILRIILNSKARKRFDGSISVNKRNSTDEAEYVPAGIDLERFKFRKRDFNIESVLKLGYLGRLSPEKGYDNLLIAAEILNKRDIEFNLKFAGEVKSEKRFSSRIENLGLNEKIEYSGETEFPEEFLNHIDFLILPSFTEGMPMTILEAMCSGVIVISNDVGGISEVIEHGKNGFLLKDNKSDTIADFVENLRESNHDLQSIAEEAFKTARNFTTKRLAESFNSKVIKMLGDS